MDERIIEYIRKNLELGYELEKIKGVLVSAGHDVKEVELCAEHALKKPKIKKIVIISSLIILIVVLAVLAFRHLNFIKPPDKIVNSSNQAKMQEDIANLNNVLISNDKSACGSINDENLRLRCEGNTTKPLNQSCGDGCNDKIALNKALISQNRTICLEINDTIIKSYCQSAIK